MASRRGEKEDNEEEEGSRNLRSSSSSSKKHNFTFTRSSSSASSDHEDDDGSGPSESMRPSESMKLFETFAKSMNISVEELHRRMNSDERRNNSDPSSSGPSTSTSDTLTHAEQCEALFRGGDAARFERLLISLNLHGKFQTLLSVTAILHAVAISPSSSEDVPRVDLYYSINSDLGSANEKGGETVTVLSQAQVTARRAANDNDSFFCAHLSANQIEAIAFGVEQSEGLSTAPLNHQRLHQDGSSPGPDLINDFCKLQRALLQATSHLESSSEECRTDRSAKGRNQFVIQDEELDRVKQTSKTTADQKLTKELIDEFLNTSDFMKLLSRQILNDDVLSAINVFFHAGTDKDFQWFVVQQGTPSQIVGDTAFVSTNGGSGRVSVAASSTAGGEKTSFFGTSSSNGGSSRWTHSLPPSSECYPPGVSEHVFNLFYPFIQSIACGLYKVDKDSVQKHIMHEYYQSKIRLIVLRLANLYKEQFGLPWIDEWVLDDESFFKERQDHEAFRWTLQLNPTSLFLNTGCKRVLNLSSEQGSNATRTLIRGFGKSITLNIDLKALSVLYAMQFDTRLTIVNGVQVRQIEHVASFINRVLIAVARTRNIVNQEDLDLSVFLGDPIIAKLVVDGWREFFDFFNTVDQNFFLKFYKEYKRRRAQGNPMVLSDIQAVLKEHRETIFSLKSDGTYFMSQAGDPISKDLEQAFCNLSSGSASSPRSSGSGSQSGSPGKKGSTPDPKGNGKTSDAGVSGKLKSFRASGRQVAAMLHEYNPNLLRKHLLLKKPKSSLPKVSSNTVVFTTIPLPNADYVALCEKFTDFKASFGGIHFRKTKDLNLSTIDKGLLDELWSKLISSNFHLSPSKAKAFSAQAEASLSSDGTIETRAESDASSARSHGSGSVPHGGFPPHSPAPFFAQMPPQWIPSPNMQHMPMPPPMMPPMQPGPHFIPMMPQWPHAPSMVNGSQASSSSVDQQSTVSEISSTSSDAVESGASSKASGNSPNSSFPAGNYGV